MALRYLVGGGNGLWGSNTNWSATSGGASGASFPTALDDVFFDAASGATSITANGNGCLSLTVANAYTGTFTVAAGNFQVQSNGSITLGTGMTIAGTGTLIIGGPTSSTCTMTSNGVVWGRPLSLTCLNGTYNLSGDWQVTDFAISNAGSGAIQTINNNTMRVSGNFTISADLGGTTNFILNGTGTAAYGFVRNFRCTSLEVNTSGTITFSGTLYFSGNCIFRYVAGTTNASTGLSVSSAAAVGQNYTLTGWTQILDMTQRGNSIVTLSNNMTCRDFLTGASDGGTGQQLNGFTLSITRNLNTPRIAGATVFGTTVFNMIGTGTITTTNASISNNIVINTAGTITLAGLFLTGTNTITHTSGTINPGASVLTRSNTGPLVFALSSSGFQLFSMTVPNLATTTVNTNTLLMTGTLTCSGTATFNGSAGITTANLTAAASAATLTWLSGNTYTCTGSMSVSGANSSPINFYASIVNGVKAIFNLQSGATQANFFINARDIDSSGGQTVYDALGTVATLTRTINWNDGSRPRTTIRLTCGVL